MNIDIDRTEKNAGGKHQGLKHQPDISKMMRLHDCVSVVLSEMPSRQKV
jgi:hypothetical protein